MSSNTSIYLGFWVNNSKESSNASTLTLSNTDGGILIAALAIFIQIVGGQSWSILCFIMHQIRTARRPMDGLHHQQQATLRNNNSDIKTLWNLASMWWSWRKIPRKAFRRSIGLVLIGTTHLLIFGAAGVLSSHITTVGNQVLMRASPRCGPWKRDIYDHDALYAADALNASDGELEANRHVTAFSNHYQDLLHLSGQYVESCVRESRALPECNRFMRSQLNWTSTKVSCPYQDLCLGPPNSSIFMSSGFLDSRDDFGINGRDEERVTIKQTMVCSPIKTEGYTKGGTTPFNYRPPNNQTSNKSTSKSTVNYTAAFYGSTVYNTSAFGFEDPILENATYIYTNYRGIASTFYNGNVPPYDIITMSEYVNEGPPRISLIPALSKANSTVNLIFASFFGWYSAPSDDLWLPAHQKLQLHGGTNGNYNDPPPPYIGADNVFSVMACSEQIQLCSPSKVTRGSLACTEPASSHRILNDTLNRDNFKEIFDKEKQLATALALAHSGVYGGIRNVLEYMPLPLLAQRLTTARSSLPPAPNQWVLEVEGWFQVALAMMQHKLVDYISGPSPEFARYGAYNSSNIPSDLKWLCGAQITRRNEYINFSTLAIGLVLGFGLAIICVSLILERCVGHIRERRGKVHLWRQKLWWSDGMLQIQKRAFEAIGVRDWKLGHWEEVPVTSKKLEWSWLDLDEEKGQSAGSQGSSTIMTPGNFHPLGSGTGEEPNLGIGGVQDADSEQHNSAQQSMEQPRDDHSDTASSTSSVAAN